MYDSLSVASAAPASPPPLLATTLAILPVTKSVTSSGDSNLSSTSTSSCSSHDQSAIASWLLMQADSSRNVSAPSSWYSSLQQRSLVTVVFRPCLGVSFNQSQIIPAQIICALSNTPVGGRLGVEDGVPGLHEERGQAAGAVTLPLLQEEVPVDPLRLPEPRPRHQDLPGVQCQVSVIIQNQ